MSKRTALASKRAGVPAWRLRFALPPSSATVTVVNDATASYSLELIAVPLLNGVVYGLLPTALLKSTAANSQRKACIAVTPSL